MSFIAAGMFASYEQQAEIAGTNAEILLTTLTEEIKIREEIIQYDTAVPEEPVAAEPPKVTLAGYDVVGIVRVPSQGLELPVLDGWSYDMLQISPCRYSGSVDNGDLIVLGHNYKKHFSPLKKLKAGDAVEFCDVNGKTYSYSVAKTEILQKTELERLTTTEHDLTLFTCTNGGYRRFVVRCDLIPESPELQ